MNAHSGAYHCGPTAVDAQMRPLGMSADRIAVREFLQALSARAVCALKGVENPGVLQLFRLHPTDKAATPSRYAIDDVERMIEDAIAASDAGHNSYIEGRTVRSDLRGQKRGALEDTGWVFAIVIDSDADKGLAWAGSAQASAVVETSPGNAHYWFFFRNAITAAEGKALGDRIRASAGADRDTGTVTQPYRVAGTVNYPSLEKQKRGRTTTPTRLVNLTDRLWTPDELIEAFPLPGSKNGGGDDDGGGGGQHHGSFNESAIPAELMTLIHKGVGEPHRSKQFFRAVAWLKRIGWAIDGITMLLERYPNGIAAKYEGRIGAEVERVYDKIEENQRTNDSKLAEMNEKYCVVLDGARTRVLTFEQYSRRVGRHQYVRFVPTFLGFEDFRNLHMNKFVTVGDEVLQLGHWWLRHPNRRQYAGITFQPGGGDVVDNRLNLWRGWGVEPKQGDWSLMRDHIRQVIALNDEEVLVYVLNWLAWAVQHPDERAEVALVFRGKRGTGKGALGNAMCRIFGQHAVHISSADHLAGRFNAHLRDACLLFADESYWPGDKSAEGTLKRMITEPELLIEPKHRDAVTTPNMLHVLMASNEDWVVPAGEHERRFAVFNVSECHMQEDKYFTPLFDQLENGGYSAMLFDLLDRDLEGWHPRHFPRTDALREQQRQGLQPLDAWWVELLETGVLEGADPNAPNCAVSNGYDRIGIKQRGLYDQARTIEPRLKPRNDHVLGHFLTDQDCDNSQKILRRRGWTFPPLLEARKKWEARFPGWKWRDPRLAAWQCGEDKD
jgi:Family of unknown function (DUF5906)/RepB DNA-primase from phage plasmid